MHERWRFVWIAVATAVLGAGCGGAPTTSSSPDASGPRAEISWSPQQPIALRPLTFELRILDASGRSLDVVDVKATAAMPEMDHGTEALRLTRDAPGRYRGAHTFSMDGTWRLTFEGTADGRPVTVRVAVEVGR